jgi:hypothetical protein
VEALVLLPLFLRVGSAMMCRTIVVLQYCRRSVSFLNYWFSGHMYEDLKGQLEDCQHGYVKGRSTVSDLLEYFSFVLKSIENGCQVDLIYLESEFIKLVFSD